MAAPVFDLDAEQIGRLLSPAAYEPPDDSQARCVPASGARSAPDWLDEAITTLSCTPEARTALGRDAQATLPENRLTAAALCNDAGAATRIVAEGARPNDRDACGWTALVVAASTGHVDVIRALLAAGAKPNVVSRAGRSSRSPLLAAVMRGDSAAANVLLDAHASAAATTGGGRDALMYAATGVDADLVRRLLRRDADACRKDHAGITAAQLAGAFANDGVASLLKRAWHRCSRRIAKVAK